MQVTIVWLKSPQHFTSKKVIRWVDHGVKVSSRKVLSLCRNLCNLNEVTVKRQTTYEDLRMLKSVVRTQDFMLSLDVESVFFHVPIHPKHRKFFSSHLALPLFVSNKFIDLYPGGYFV
jgi:hypothetical protein